MLDYWAANIKPKTLFLTPSATGDLLLLAIITLMAGHAWWLHKQGRWLLFDPLNFFWGGALIVYVFQPITHAATFISWHPAGLLEQTLFWILFGLVFVILGYEARWGQAWARKLPRPPARIASNRLRLAGVFFIALGLIGYKIQFASAGSTSEWLAVGRGATDYGKVGGYTVLLEYFLPAGVLLWIFDVNIHRSSVLSKLVSYTFAALMLLWLIYLGARSRTIMFVGFILMAYFLPRKRNPPFWLIVQLFLTLLALIEFQANYREKFTNLSFNIDEIDKEEAARLILPSWLGGDKKSKAEIVSTGIEFNCVMAVIEVVPEKVDYNYGSCMLEFLTRPIPRSVWPEKRYPFYEAFTPIYEQGNLAASEVEGVQTRILAGPSFTLIGHYFAIGGAVGLIFGGLLTGVMLRTLRSYLDENRTNESVLIIYPLLSGIGFNEACGEPLFWVFTVPFTVIPLFLMLHFCGEQVSKRRPRHPASKGSGDARADNFPFNQTDRRPAARVAVGRKSGSRLVK